MIGFMDIVRGILNIPERDSSARGWLSKKIDNMFFKDVENGRDGIELQSGIRDLGKSCLRTCKKHSMHGMDDDMNAYVDKTQNALIGVLDRTKNDKTRYAVVNSLFDMLDHDMLRHGVSKDNRNDYFKKTVEAGLRVMQEIKEPYYQRQVMNIVAHGIDKSGSSWDKIISKEETADVVNKTIDVMSKLPDGKHDAEYITKGTYKDFIDKNILEDRKVANAGIAALLGGIGKATIDREAMLKQCETLENGSGEFNHRGQKNGVWVLETEKYVEKTTYKDGVPEGVWEKVYHNGNFIRGTLSDGKKNGAFEERNDQFERQAMYKHDKLWGDSVTVFADGSKEQIYYSNNRKEGVQLKEDADGRKTATRYYNGDPVEGYNHDIESHVQQMEFWDNAKAMVGIRVRPEIQSHNDRVALAQKVASRKWD